MENDKNTLNSLHEKKMSLVSYRDKISFDSDGGMIGIWGEGRNIYLNHLHDLAEEISEVDREIRHLCSILGFPREITCPHCGYVHQPQADGDKGSPYLRILELVLRPYRVNLYDPEVGVLKISDHTEESFDVFDQISSPQPEDYMDNIGDDQDDCSYRAVRKFAKGRALFICGKCYGFFDASRIKRNMYISI